MNNYYNDVFDEAAAVFMHCALALNLGSASSFLKATINNNDKN